MLILKDISKSFPQRGTVLDKLNLTVNAGETLAVTGPSGSGKTTLLNIVGLLDKADKGSIIFNGSSIENYDAEESAVYRRESIGFVFQDHLLLPHLTVIENIYLPLLAGKKTRESIEESKIYIDNLLKNTGIYEIINRYPHEISGGEAQRATLVRALANKPLLLLADEPTGSLDSENSDSLASLLKEINTEYNTAIIAVTHSDKFAKSLNKQWHLVEGKLLSQK